MALLALALLLALTRQCLLSEADTPVSTAVVTDKVLLGLNLLRTARMKAPGKRLNEKAEQETAAQSALREKFPNKESCASLDARGAQVNGFFLEVQKGLTDKAQFTSLLQKELEAGLEALNGPQYNPETTFNDGSTPFDNSSAQNAAYLMFPDSTEVGCALAADCENGKDFLLCLFNPTLEAERVPFPADLYKSMLERKAAKVDLSKLTEEDYDTPLYQISRAVTDNLLLGLNLLRTARMDTRGQLVKKSQENESAAKAALQRVFPFKSTCDDSGVKPAALGGFFYISERNLRADEHFPALLQKELEAGLEAVKGSEYNPETTFDTENTPFDTSSAQNAAYLMFPDSTEVGCAVADQCENNKDYLLCTFSPKLVHASSIPFPADLYKSMLERKEAKVDLSKLTQEDYNTSLDHTSAAGAGTRISAGLLALTFTGMLAF